MEVLGADVPYNSLPCILGASSPLSHTVQRTRFCRAPVLTSTVSAGGNSAGETEQRLLKELKERGVVGAPAAKYFRS